MKDKMKCYIDSFEIITVLLDKNLYVPNKMFFLLEGENKIRLEILDDYDEYAFPVNQN